VGLTRKFYTTKKPGANLHQAVENPEYGRSQILEVDSDGTVLGRLPYLPDTEYMYAPVPDPAYDKPQYVVTTEGELEIPRIIPEDKITVGENPFIQLIYRYVKRAGGATEEDIIRHMVKEKRVIRPDKRGLKRLKAYVAEMHKGKTLGGLLLVQDNRFVVGLKLSLGKHLLDFVTGYDPFEYHIMKYAENKGVVSRDEIHRYLLDKLKWARTGKVVEHYIEKLLKEKCLKFVGKNWFEFKRFPEMIGYHEPKKVPTEFD